MNNKTKIETGRPSFSSALLGEIQRLLCLCSGREFRNPKAGKWTIELEFHEAGPATNLYSVLEHVRNSHNTDTVPAPNNAAPLGFCPICGANGATRERRPNGNDRCSAGHTYPSRDSVAKQVSDSSAPIGAELSGSVNWSADAWFAMHHAADLTDEFKTWWVAFYGCPEGYPDNEDEQHDYWVRCAFALGGWLAARQPVSERKDGEQ